MFWENLLPVILLGDCRKYQFALIYRDGPRKRIESWLGKAIGSEAEGQILDKPLTLAAYA